MSSDDEPKYVSELAAIAHAAFEAENEAVEQAVIRGIGLGYGTAVVRNWPSVVADIGIPEEIIKLPGVRVANHPWVPDCEVYFFENLDAYLAWTEKEADERAR